MTTILAIFLLALALSLVLTPVSGRAGAALGALDHPSGRKVHTHPISRTGGAAVFASFFLTLYLGTFFKTGVSELLVITRPVAFLLAGGVVVFATGLADDMRRLGPGVKLIFQVAGVSLAYSGGVAITGFTLGGVRVDFGFLSYFVTVFWFVLFINAVNLIDGLAGGVTAFACGVMTVLATAGGDYCAAMIFAALCGSVMGFLRYNFNPATIFLGDGGSYFLGYTIAGLSVLCSIKSRVGAAMLIPILALGVPVFDTILSPVRRFLLGRKMFSPDTGHIHHRLRSMGLTTHKVVTALHGATFGLCVLALVVVNIRDETAGLLLMVLAAGAIVFVRKLGYFEYFSYDKVLGWLRDVTDEAGISHERRSFLSLQLDTFSSTTLEDLWENMIRAVDILAFDYAAMYVNDRNGAPYACDTSRGGEARSSSKERRKTVPQKSSVSMRAGPPAREWMRDGAPDHDRNCPTGRTCLRIEVPLIVSGGDYFGSLVLIKDLKRGPITHSTLRRVEHLRRTTISTLEKIVSPTSP